MLGLGPVKSQSRNCLQSAVLILGLFELEMSAVYWPYILKMLQSELSAVSPDQWWGRVYLNLKVKICDRLALY